MHSKRKMQLLILVCLGLVGFVASEPLPSYGGFNYHERVGIKAAARIKAAEEATDFDGSRIVGGSAAVLGEFPFMAGISITLRIGHISVCGGTLLSNTRVLTAGHCWWDGRNRARLFIVILGAVQFNLGTRITTSNVQTHPKWDGLSLENDLAVATFPWVTYTTNIQNAALPSGWLAYHNLVGLSGDVAGFGIVTDAGTVLVSQALRSVSLEVVDNSLCRSLYGPRVSNEIICARGLNGRSTCDGDTGGPMVIMSGEQPMLVGVAAFNHPDSCQLGFPVGFTRVTTHLKWIKEFLIW